MVDQIKMIYHYKCIKLVIVLWLCNIWEDVYRLHANIMPFHIRNLSIPGFWNTQWEGVGVPAPIPHEYPGTTVLGETLVVFRTTSTDRKEEIDWFSSQLLIHPQSIHNEYPQELMAYMDQLTHLTNAFRPCRCTQKENTCYLTGSVSSLKGIGQS